MVTNYTLDTCKGHAPIHMGPVFLPCSAGHSESYGPVRAKNGTGKLEYLRTFDISDALSGRGGQGEEAEAPRALWGLFGPQLSRHSFSLWKHQAFCSWVGLTGSKHLTDRLSILGAPLGKAVPKPGVNQVPVCI